MAKTFKLHPITNLDGDNYKVPIFDSFGFPERENHPTYKQPDGKPVEMVRMKEATLIDILDLLVRRFPKERMTMDNVTQATILKKALLSHKKDGRLVLEEGTHDWVKKMLNDDKVGIEVFGLMTKVILDEVEDFDRAKEAK